MPRISLTDFVDFVTGAGPSKISKVRSIRTRPGYAPTFDYWKQLRDGIRGFHKSGARSRSELDKIAGKIQDPGKHARYVAAIEAYKKFLGRRKIAWFDPPALEWTHGELTVRINPELGLEIDGTPFAVKLYFKKDALSRNRVAVVLDMMTLAIAEMGPSRDGRDVKAAVLDVPSGKLIGPGAANPQIDILLESEAAAFLQVWDSLGEPPEAA